MEKRMIVDGEWFIDIGRNCRIVVIPDEDEPHLNLYPPGEIDDVGVFNWNDGELDWFTDEITQDYKDYFLAKIQEFRQQIQEFLDQAA